MALLRRGGAINPPPPYGSATDYDSRLLFKTASSPDQSVLHLTAAQQLGLQGCDAVYVSP